MPNCVRVNEHLLLDGCKPLSPLKSREDIFDFFENFIKDMDFEIMGRIMGYQTSQYNYGGI